MSSAIRPGQTLADDVVGNDGNGGNSSGDGRSLFRNSRNSAPVFGRGGFTPVSNSAGMGLNSGGGVGQMGNLETVAEVLFNLDFFFVIF